MTREAALHALLRTLFSPEELRLHLAFERESSAVVTALPEMGVSADFLTGTAVDALKRHGFIDRDFFDRLEAVRPKRLAEIRKVRAQWLAHGRLDRGELWAEGRYELISPCGIGGFGCVWKATDTRTGAYVALKILLEQHSEDRRIRQRFSRGAAVLATLSHPALVRVHSGVEQDGLRFFYAMEFISGDTLAEVVGKHSPTELLKYVLQIGDALTHIHARQLLHRDIKPSNILVSAGRQAKLIDFDLVTGDAFTPMTTRTLGTAHYSPPEAHTSEKKLPAYDVFSLARTVEFVLRGREPTIAESVKIDTIASLDIAEPLKKVLRAALRVDPAERTQSARQFCDELRTALLASPSMLGPTDSAKATPSTSRARVSTSRPPPPPIRTKAPTSSTSTSSSSPQSPSSRAPVLASTPHSLSPSKLLSRSPSPAQSTKGTSWARLAKAAEQHRVRILVFAGVGLAALVLWIAFSHAPGGGAPGGDAPEGDTSGGDTHLSSAVASLPLADIPPQTKAAVEIPQPEAKLELPPLGAEQEVTKVEQKEVKKVVGSRQSKENEAPPPKKNSKDYSVDCILDPSKCKDDDDITKPSGGKTTNEDYSVDCILDPSKCKPEGGVTKPTPAPNLPETLALSDIQAGVNPVKANAKTTCASKAKGGEKVSIKLAISGPQGIVISSTVVDDAGNAALANCVAGELKKATFKKVQKEKIGTQISLSF